MFLKLSFHTLNTSVAIIGILTQFKGSVHFDFGMGVNCFELHGKGQKRGVYSIS